MMTYKKLALDLYKAGITNKTEIMRKVAKEMNLEESTALRLKISRHINKNLNKVY